MENARSENKAQIPMFIRKNVYKTHSSRISISFAHDKNTREMIAVLQCAVHILRL